MSSSTILYKYRVFCVTENTYVYWWLDSTQSPPTECSNNTADTINSSLTCIVAQINNVQSIVSTTNSSTTPLAANATFTGGYENIQSYSSINISGSANTIGTLYTDFSNDAENIVQTITLTDGLNGNFGTRDITPKAQYVRVRLINSTTAQTSLHLQTIYKITSRLSTSRGADSPNLYDDCILTKSLLYGQNENNRTFNNIGVSGERNLKVSLEEPISSLGLVLVSNLYPKIQISANYGQLTSDVESITNLSGYTSVANGLFTVNTGTASTAHAVTRSKQLISYFPGAGIRTRFSVMFSAPVAYSIQAAGLHTTTDFIGVGYYNTQFGVDHRIPGKSAIYTLTITNGTSGDEVHSITLNNIACTTIATVGSLNSQQLAQRIADNIVAPGWTFALSPYSNDNKVVFIQYVPWYTSGTFSYSASGTATGTFASIQSGVPNDIGSGFIPQSSFNIDILDGSNSPSNPSGMLFDPSKLNLFQVCMSYSGTFLFYILTPNGKFILFHRYLYSNLYTVPSQQNPSYHFGWIIASMGSTTNISMSGTEASGFIEGETRINRPPFGHYRNNFIASTTETTIFGIRCGGLFRNVINGRELLLINFSMALSESSGGISSCIFYLNPTFIGDVNWQYVNSNVSCAEYCDPTNTFCTGGTVLCNFSGAPHSSLTFDLRPMQIHLSPGDVLALSIVSNVTLTTNVSLTWYE